MNYMKFFFLTSLSLFCSFAFADEDPAALDPRPPIIHPVQEESPFFDLGSFQLEDRQKRSDLKAVFERQTPVKSQGRRGTCSIFSATAIIESLIKIRFEDELDLSENFLEFLVMDKMKSQATEGSSTGWNIPAAQRYGMIFEATWPYEIYDWTKASLPSSEKKRADKLCGKLKGNKKQVCLLSHLPPGDTRYDGEAREVRREYLIGNMRYGILSHQSYIKQQLNNNKPLVLGLEFFYGAWNHSKMTQYGIGKRDMKKWSKGIVSNPTQKDIRLSRKHPAGHSFVIVGYDDVKRVYYFKNSWGRGSFGRTSDLLGKGTTPGYGTIAYNYAHNYGTFYQVWFNN